MSLEEKYSTERKQDSCFSNPDFNLKQFKLFLNNNNLDCAVIYVKGGFVKWDQYDENCNYNLPIKAIEINDVEIINLCIKIALKNGDELDVYQQNGEGLNLIQLSEKFKAWECLEILKSLPSYKNAIANIKRCR